MKQTNGYLSRTDFWAILTPREKAFFEELHAVFDSKLIAAKKINHRKQGDKNARQET